MIIIKREPEKTRANSFNYDYWLLFTAILLLSIGLLLLASASLGVAGEQYHNSFHFLMRQIIYIMVGIGFIAIIIRVPLSFWEHVGGQLILLSIALLCLVLIPGIGKQINGSTRWIGMGILTLQVSELVKFAMVIYMAGYLVRRQDEVHSSIKGFLKPMLLLAIVCGLLLREPDFGAAVVIVCTVLGMLFLARARLWQFAILLIVVGAIFSVIAIDSPYRLARLTSFINPWATPFGSGYQLTQSLIAFGRGGIFGVGLGNGIQKLFYLPEAHTDFLFAVLAEEWGVIGQAVVLALFGFFVWRILYLGKTAEKLHDNFIAYLAYGLGLLLGLQVIINVGVNLGLLPTKGLTLPLMSYGGSSMLFNCAIVGIILRIYHELHQDNLQLITKTKKHRRELRISRAVLKNPH